MIAWIHPSFFLFAAAAFLPFVKKKEILLLGAPILSFLTLLIFPEGEATTSLMNISLTLGRVDRLSLVFGYIFTAIILIGMIYSLHVTKIGEHISALLYAGSAIGAVFAGDLITLFLFWEGMAFASAFLILFGGNTKAGLRYILIHIAGGVFLLAGILIYLAEGHDMAFTSFTQMGFGLDHMGLGPTLILIGFLVNAAVPPIHAWLADAYPEASVTGIVFLSAFTTKTAVYVLIRGFPGFTPLAILGAVMTLYGVLYAMLENDIRRLLAYHIISQVGFMVAAVGIGTEMAINGAVAHAFAHILYKALLMMGMSAVFFMTGEKRCDRLGGLARVMPATFFLYMIGGFSISGVPFFSGFISKSLTISAAAEAHMIPVYGMLVLASCGTFLSTTLKLPYVVFLGVATATPNEQRPLGAVSMAMPSMSDPPRNMLIGMGLAASLCLLLGLIPDLLYRLLPYSVSYHPYTAEHLISSLLFLSATALSFIMALHYLHPHATISLDTDWFYRKGAALFVRLAMGPIAAYEAFISTFYQKGVIRPMKRVVAGFLRFDHHIIDGMVNGVGTSAFRGSRVANLIEKYVIYGVVNLTGFSNHVGARLFRRLQTGSVHNYAIMMILGIFILINLYFFVRAR